MFSGIIEAIGEIRYAEPAEGGLELSIGAPFGDLSLGESVCVSGICLTVISFATDHFKVDVSAETLRRSKLGRLATGSPVNLERSLRLGDRLSGHLVFGHVDAVGSLRSTRPEGDSAIYEFEAPHTVARYLVERGSVAVDGISLTVFGCEASHFSVAVIPHTARVTTLGTLRAGDEINLEADMIAKYVEKLRLPYTA